MKREMKRREEEERLLRRELRSKRKGQRSKVRARKVEKIPIYLSFARANATRALITLTDMSIL